jgi:anhydro-N-acetylmuramic acid kinase
MLRDRAAGRAVRTFEELGWRSKDRETLAFALMGYAAWFGLPNTLPSATGARRAVVAGRIARP